MSMDLWYTICGAVLAALSAIQPAMSAIDGTFDWRDGIQVVIAAVIAGLGYFLKEARFKP